MEYQFCPGSSKEYATSLKLDSISKKLIWDVSKGTDTLVVQTPYGEKLENDMLQYLSEQLNQREMQKGTYTQLADDLCVYYVSAEEKASNGGCAIHRKACRYTVLACREEGGICRIYEPYEQGMNVPYCDISLEIEIQIQKQMTVTRGIIGRIIGIIGRIIGIIEKKEKLTEFYTLTFPKELKNNFIEGGLCYKAGGLEIPVTKEMVARETVYIETDEEPEIIPLNHGILLKNR